MENIVLLADKKSNAWDFAEKIQQYIKFTKQENFPLYDIPLGKFRNQETRIEPTENIRKKEVYYIADPTKNPNELWVELMLVKDMALRASVASYNLVLPDLPYQRQDRKDKARVPISARVFADTISPNTSRIITMDLHADQIQGFYPATTPLDPLKSFPVVSKYLISNHKDDLENLLIVAPDQGEVKRALSFQRRLEKTGIDNSGFGFMIKARKKAGEIQDMKYTGEDPNGKNILLLDDIIDSANTLCTAASVLKEKGAQKLMGYGTHGLFTKGTCELKNYFNHIFTSNTHNFPWEGVEVIDVSPLFAEAIYRAQKGSSISELFE